MRRVLFLAACAVALVAAVSPATAAPQRVAPSSSYLVLYQDGTSLASARLAVRAAGGFLVRENLRVGVATATSSSPTFAAELAHQGAVAGVARNKPVGYNAPATRQRRSAEQLTAAERASLRKLTARAAAPPAADPLGSLQWDMAMIRATPSGSYAVEQGDRRVLVGVLDTGIDGTHPDIAPNFDAALSRNFTVDVPLVDGPCADEADGSCNDAANVDENGHGTHVAGTIASPLNGLGMAGVAPNVRLVNLRAGQDSGYFFLQPSVDALTFAGDNGIDVVNMSYYIDPWLYNCTGNPADSATAQLEQRTIIEATSRALEYARKNGVTLIAAAGNDHTDLDNPTSDATSPDFPPATAYPRTVDNSCLNMPTEGPNVVSVGSVGPSTTKADYSNWGAEGVDVTAPGGYFRDLFGTPAYRTVATQILGPYPLNVAQEEGTLNPDGTPNTPFVVRDCQGTTCAYYQYIQGTSMASPHAVGVAALIVSRYGRPDPLRSGLELVPNQTEKILMRTATPHACPNPPVLDYTNVGRPASWTATCTGTAEENNIWGTGIVDALRAVTDRNG
jgi:lantibiotic leader peptide-processing serine protease